MVFSRIHSPYRCTPQWLRKTGTEKIWVSVVESRLKVLAPNPAISLRLRPGGLMGGRHPPWYMGQLEDTATNHVPFPYESFATFAVQPTGHCRCTRAGA